jgi:hypothetical protein
VDYSYQNIPELRQLPFQFAGERLSAANRRIQMSTGVLSCAFGLYLAVTICPKLS